MSCRRDRLYLISKKEEGKERERKMEKRGEMANEKEKDDVRGEWSLS